MHFTDQLAVALRRVGNPVMVGLDPRAESLPRSFLPHGGAAAPHEVAEAYRRFCEGVIDVVAELVAVVKPQSAFFEACGPPGMEALAQVIRYARSKRLMVILDAKRNDIGSTANAYAHAYLGATSVWGADALTVSPYLGDDSLAPFIETAQQRGAGVFVLVKTSNPGGKQLQDVLVKGQGEEAPLYRRVADHLEAMAIQSLGECGYGVVGAVVGATYPEQLVELREVMKHCWLLVPGYGAQGAGAQDVAGAFDAHGLGAVINSSRGIIFAHLREEYKDQFGEQRWQDAVEAAAREMIEQLRENTRAGNLMQKM